MWSKYVPVKSNTFLIVNDINKLITGNKSKGKQNILRIYCTFIEFHNKVKNIIFGLVSKIIWINSPHLQKMI